MTPANQAQQTELGSIQIPHSTTIIETMKVIDQGAVQIAFVVSSSDRLQGVLTDGDLRRAIIGGAQLDDPVGPFVAKNFRSVTPRTGRTEALDLMKSLCIKHLPVLNEQEQLVGLHLLNELIRPNLLPHAALILAGGKGSRLGSLTQSTPKPMIKVAGRPILERIILHLVGNGVRNIFLSVNYLAEIIEDYFGDGSRLGCSIQYLHETEPLGTGGPLALLPQRALNQPVIVMNGDLIVDFDVTKMLEAHEQHNSAITIGSKTYSHQVPFGCLQTTGRRVHSIVEKPTINETINTGIYVISPELIDRVPPEFMPITDLIETALVESLPVESFEIDEWIDIGRPQQLETAQGNPSIAELPTSKSA